MENNKIISGITAIKDQYKQQLDKLYNFFMEIEVIFGVTRRAAPHVETFTDKGYIAKIGKTGTEYTPEFLLERVDALREERIIPYCIVSMLSLFEDFMFDILKYLITNVNHRPILNKNKIDSAKIFEYSNIYELRKEFIQKELDSKKYEPIESWFEFLNSIVNIEKPEKADLLKLTEIKVSRNIFIHNSNIINQIYIQKSGEYARHHPGENNVMDINYFESSFQLIENMILTTFDRLIGKFNK